MCNNAHPGKVKYEHYDINEEFSDGNNGHSLNALLRFRRRA